jgi:cytochrome c oxidase assembly factor CtaG
MFNLLLAAQLSLWKIDLWYAIPAIVAVSLVYAATRHEQMRPILYHAGRVAIWITGFLIVVSVVIQFVSSRLLS